MTGSSIFAAPHISQILPMAYIFAPIFTMSAIAHFYRPGIISRQFLPNPVFLPISKTSHAMPLLKLEAPCLTL